MFSSIFQGHLIIVFCDIESLKNHLSCFIYVQTGNRKAQLCPKKLEQKHIAGILARKIVIGKCARLIKFYERNLNHHLPELVIHSVQLHGKVFKPAVLAEGKPT